MQETAVGMASAVSFVDLHNLVPGFNGCLFVREFL